MGAPIIIPLLTYVRKYDSYMIWAGCMLVSKAAVILSLTVTRDHVHRRDFGELLCTNPGWHHFYSGGHVWCWIYYVLLPNHQYGERILGCSTRNGIWHLMQRIRTFGCSYALHTRKASQPIWCLDNIKGSCDWSRSADGAFDPTAEKEEVKLGAYSYGSDQLGFLARATVLDLFSLQLPPRIGLLLSFTIPPILCVDHGLGLDKGGAIIGNHECRPGNRPIQLWLSVRSTALCQYSNPNLDLYIGHRRFDLVGFGTNLCRFVCIRNHLRALRRRVHRYVGANGDGGHWRIYRCLYCFWAFQLRQRPRKCPGRADKCQSFIGFRRHEEVWCGQVQGGRPFYSILFAGQCSECPGCVSQALESGVRAALTGLPNPLQDSTPCVLDVSVILGMPHPGKP